MARQGTLAVPVRVTAGPRGARLSWLLRLGRLARRKPLGAISALIILIMVFVALFSVPTQYGPNIGVASATVRLPFSVTTPGLAPHDPNTQLRGMKNARLGATAPDGTTLLLGGDELGRDLMARTMLGARVALQIGLIAVGIGTVLGTLLGLISGYWGGWGDTLIQRVMDSVIAFPGLVFALMIISVLGNGTFQLMGAIGVLMIPYTARLVRGSVLSVKQNAYIEAARAIGIRDRRILLRHILPNVAAPIIILAATYFSAAIITEASLSYLGLGTLPPTPSWGGMIKGAGMDNIQREPRLLLVPGIALSLTVLGFNLFGDTLRDLWDPKLRTR
jgi:ABC-type dipeptide/oligopeptide/nickel transport system permease subunit